jgi:hypothetical protein
MIAFVSLADGIHATTPDGMLQMDVLDADRGVRAGADRGTRQGWFVTRPGAV